MVIDALITLCGILGALFFVVFLYVMGKRYLKFDFKGRQISEYSIYPGVAEKFHFSIVIFSLTQILFVARLLSFYGLLNRLEVSLPLLVPLFMFLTIPYFSLKRFRRTHIILAVVGFSLMFVGGLSFAFSLLSLNFYCGIVSLLISLVVLSLVWADFFKNKNVYASSEFAILWGIFFWDIINALPLIF